MVDKEPEAAPRRTPAQRPAPDPDLEETRPLYRDEVAGGASGGTTSSRSGPGGRGDAGSESGAGDATQILPRTPRGGYPARSDFDRDDEDDLDAFGPPPGRIGRRTKLVLVVAAVAAVVVVGLVIGYVLLGGDRGVTRAGTAQPTTGASPSPSASSGSPSPDANALLGDATMLSVAQVRGLVADRTWKVALTQRGTDEDAAQPACLGPDAVEGTPASRQTILRLLSASGTKPPVALHRADAYATPEEATQAYGLAARALGGCTMTGAYLSSGGVVTGLGDQSAGAVVNVTVSGATTFHSVLLNRTGRVVNTVDVAQPGAVVPLAGAATSLAAVTNTQCRTAAGRCAAATRVQPGPPPVGGDQPGFLATGDLPPVGRPNATWAGTVPAPPDADFSGSGCETVSWAKTPADRRVARTYLLQDQSLTFGLDAIVLTEPNAANAASVVAQVKGDLDSCASRKLTATVSAPRQVRGTGAGGAAIAGWTATVSQRTTEGTARYRVGIVSAGTKVVYTFLNPQPKLDLTDAQWSLVTVRAGERATQVR